MENIQKHVNVELVTSSTKMEKLVGKPTFKSAKRFNPHLVAVDTIREKLLLNKPVYTGFAVLDLSKVLMYQLPLPVHQAQVRLASPAVVYRY